MKSDKPPPGAADEERGPARTEGAASRSKEHLPQLDGVRALAVLLVSWWHFMPDNLAHSNPAPWGAIGVALFFTLSGFLITRILLDCKDKILKGSAATTQMMRQFYVRRFLRIFPLYYGVLLFIAVVNPDGARARLPYHVAYLSNFFFAYTHKLGFIERHFWSLAVEEQFYLVWPLLIFLTPKRALAPVIVGTIVAAPIWRFFTYTPGLSIHEWMTPGALDLLGGGALLALVSLPEYGLTRWQERVIQVCGLIGVPLFLINITARSLAVGGVPESAAQVSLFGIHYSVVASKSGWIGPGLDWYGGLTYPSTALASVWLIGSAARGFRGLVGAILSSSPLQYIGKISYGIYVIHMFVPSLLGHMFHWEWAKTGGWGQLVVFFGMSVGLASISWYAFEAPINRLKKYFEYGAPSGRASQSSKKGIVASLGVASSAESKATPTAPR